LACPRQVRRRAVPDTGELRRFAQGDPVALVPLDLDDHRSVCRCCCCAAAACSNGCSSGRVVQGLVEMTELTLRDARTFLIVGASLAGA
jgi:hypothetical protein